MNQTLRKLLILAALAKQLENQDFFCSSQNTCISNSTTMSQRKTQKYASNQAITVGNVFL